jgi:glycosyltransferase involved in cell wall biosynthesis
VALYVGRIEVEKGAHAFAAASEYTDTRLVLIGSGKERERLMREYPKAFYLPETKYRDIGEVLSMADVLVVPNSAQTKDASVYTSPLKAFAYLAAKKPIVATRVPALEAIFDTDVTYAVPDDPVSLAKAIDEATTVPTRAPYTWDARADAILSHL